MIARLVPLLLLASSTGCFFLDEPYKERHGTVPVQLDDGWEIATPESVGLDPRVLASIHDELLREDRHFGALGFLVIKDGKLVFETWLRDEADRDSVHHLQSATKSVTSLAYGLALQRGLVAGPEATLCSLIGTACDGLDPRKRAITIGHLLTMRSGIDFPNDSFSMEMWVERPADPLRYILEKPLSAAPGTLFDYRDADPQLLGYALQRQTGRTEAELVEEWLFEPLGIRDFHWEHGGDGVTLAAHGLHLRPRDFARIGQLALDGGRWQGEPIVSTTWIDVSLAPQSASDRDDFAYGYLWWVLPGERAFAAWGHGGQFLLVVPGQRLVLLQIARPDASLHGSHLADFVELTAPLRRGSSPASSAR